MMQPRSFCKSLLLCAALAFAINSPGQAPFLDTVRYTNGQFRFTIHGETKADYVVLNSTNMAQWRPIATNQGISASRNLSFAAPAANGAWRVQRLPMPWFNLAMLVRGKLDVNGNNFYVDSFDSADPLYSAVRGMYDPTKRKANGDVAAGLGLTNSLSVGSSTILGHLVTTPGGWMDMGADGSVGNLAWAADEHTGAQAGYLNDDMNVQFLDSPLPPGGGTAMTPGGTVNGVSYINILGNGNYEASSLSLSGNDAALITGTNTILYVRGDVSLTGNALIHLAPGAAFKLFVGGTSISLGGNGIINPGSALNLTYYGLGNNSTLSVSGNSTFTGVIYAPTTDISLGNGYSSNDFVGAIVAKTISLNGPVKFHFDESLQRFGPMR